MKSKVNTLVLGSGGREHAIAWKIAQSANLNQLFCLPGNPGTLSFAKNIEGSVNDFDKIKASVLENSIDLVVVGPEDPLVNGIQDFFQHDPELSNVKVIGPNKLAATMEGSKDFAKAFMTRHNIPTAAYASFTEESYEEACKFLEGLKAPYVLKADGLAAGKGVLIIDDLEEAKASLKEMFSGKFGAAGNTVVIEEFLSGIEISVFVLTDSKNYMILPQAKDYKRIGDGDTGLNTGGMGAVSPVPFADEAFMKKVEDRIIKPTIDGFAKDNFDYVGFVFIGLMNCDSEPKVIEYNVRMGDPETEAVMARIDSDLLSHLWAAGERNLASEQLKISDKTALTLIAVSGGYPEDYAKGYEITGLDQLENIISFHSGTAIKDGVLVSNGGRVLALTTLAENIQDARKHMYCEIEKVKFKDMYHRQDIGNDLIKK